MKNGKMIINQIVLKFLQSSFNVIPNCKSWIGCCGGLVNKDCFKSTRDPKNDRDQVKAIASGQGDIAVVNSYYIGLLLSSERRRVKGW